MSVPFEQVQKGQWFRCRGQVWIRPDRRIGFNAIRLDTGDGAHLKSAEPCEIIPAAVSTADNQESTP